MVAWGWVGVMGMGSDWGKVQGFFGGGDENVLKLDCHDSCTIL